MKLLKKILIVLVISLIFTVALTFICDCLFTNTTHIGYLSQI